MKPKAIARSVIGFFKSLGQEFTKDNVPLLAAAQAYYYMLSLFPMLILILSIIPYFDLDPNIVVELMYQFIPGEIASMIEGQIVNLVTEQRGGLLTFGILATIWSASNGMNTFIKAQNEAYNVKVQRPFWKARLVSIALTFGLILALIVALILPVMGDAIISFISSFGILTAELEELFRLLRWVVSISLLAMIFAALYYLAPNTKIPFRYALPGALFATLAWQLTGFGFSIYISNFANFSQTYGSLGGIIVLMLWLFLIGIVLVVGAEINAVLYRKHRTGMRRDPEDDYMI
ncbi:YihY/virulence factor BrkB family protein [Salisediminibacterium selenitireducens]|uniref:Ribonuclease BN n=1 Tax=Bacillus selenitireducens (strain ATCC 700615 / DSM 15326 / MLS10) TaxID=439292 RepID=D6Y0H8_BACIE|nr:YihY/virulence factor BrkB family protein [Salisediminibacterium selenitireducens]ADH98569.1 ribonuclease BN [[Bacillus] selenitireducens MLS10]